MPPSKVLEPHTGRYLSFLEREEIAICRAYIYGVREIARYLGRTPSTFSRELRRNAATRGGSLVYRAVIAQWHRDRRAARPKMAKLAANQRLRDYLHASPGRTSCRMGRRYRVRRYGSSGAGMVTARIGDGPPRGARSRSRPAYASISPMMRRCASPTRRSIRRSTFRAAAPCSASWSPASVPGGRCGFLVLDLGSAATVL